MNKDYSIQITPGMVNHILSPYYAEFERERDTVYFSFFMFYVIFPMLYIIFTTGNFNTIMILWSFIQSGVFDAIQGIKQFMTNTVIYMLRMIGCYTFSRYTVIKNGREVFTAMSEYVFIKNTRANIKKTDLAKYTICKWIDNECNIYRRVNNGENAKLTDTHNDIYDFIIHTFEHDTSARVHRGDFRLSTHTSLIDNYRKFSKSYQICNLVELCVSSDAVSEIIPIDLKRPINFYIEKNILLDKKFLSWYLYSILGRKDLADYISLSYSKYEVNIYYEDCMREVSVTVKPEPRVLGLLAEATAEVPALPKEAPRIRAFTVNDSQNILVGNRYIIKVDAILGCPVFESVDKDIFHIDDVLTNYYENSVCSYTDNEDQDDEDQDDDDQDDNQDDNQDDQDDESAVSDDDTETVSHAIPSATATATVTSTETVPDNEFEIIESSSATD